MESCPPSDGVRLAGRWPVATAGRRGSDSRREAAAGDERLALVVPLDQDGRMTSLGGSDEPEEIAAQTSRVASVAGTAIVAMRATSTLTVGSAQIASALRPEGVGTADIARLLALILEAQQKQQATLEELAGQVDAQLPIFSELGKHLRTGSGQMQLLALIATILFGILNLSKPAAPPLPAPSVVINVPEVPSREEILQLVEEEMESQGIRGPQEDGGNELQ